MTPENTAKRIFCAKEAAYKAQYPISQAIFDFHHLEVRFGADVRAFTATFRHPAGPFSKGDVLRGQQRLVAGHLVSTVTIGQAALKGA